MTRLDNDLISRKALLEEVEKYQSKISWMNHANDYLDDVYDLIFNAPTIEADSGEAVAVKITRSSDGRLLLTQPNGKYFDVNEAIGKTFYTSPPKREWKSLNDEQLICCYHSDPIQHSKNIQAKLKELNHGYD